MSPEELQEAKKRWNKIAGKTYGIIENYAMNRDCAAVINTIPGLFEYIDSLQAELAKKDQEIASWISDRDSWLARYEAVKKELSEQAAHNLLPVKDALEKLKTG